MQEIQRIIEKSRNYGANVIGILSIKIVDANLIRDVKTIGTMSPMVEIKIGNETIIRTPSHNHGGKQPIWNKKVSYEVKKMSEDVILTVLNAGMFGNEKIGEGIFNLTDLCHTNGELSY